MGKINEMFNEVTEELWSIKRWSSKIEIRDLIDFYKEYQSHMNLVDDAINAQIIQYENESKVPFHENDVLYMIEAFTTFNKFNYNRLIVDTLCNLKSKQAYEYLSVILDNDVKMAEFTRDFSGAPFYDYTMQEITKIKSSEQGAS